ncbi:MAG TPA: hypothetical protein VF944_10245 [Candidatus Bathyarchaeia archaeon]
MKLSRVLTGTRNSALFLGIQFRVDTILSLEMFDRATPYTEMLFSPFIFTVVRKILFASTFGSKATTARKLLVALTAHVPIWAPTSTKSSPSNG